MRSLVNCGVAVCGQKRDKVTSHKNRLDPTDFIFAKQCDGGIEIGMVLEVVDFVMVKSTRLPGGVCRLSRRYLGDTSPGREPHASRMSAGLASRTV